jgi:hypothetical protein
MSRAAQSGARLTEQKFSICHAETQASSDAPHAEKTAPGVLDKAKIY